jgi:hypothetical protein
MSFFTSSLVLNLANALELSGLDEKEDKEEEKLHDFAAIQKELLKLESKSMVSGVVSIRIKSITLFPQFKSRENLYTIIQNRNYTRKSRVVSNKELLWNDIHHFPVTVIQDVMHPFNLVKISLMELTVVQEKIKMGQVNFHLHDIIKAAPISGTYFLWNNNSQIGVLDVEITFSYGRFGYGYSFQLKEEDTNSSEKVVYSLFPRINPAYSDCEKGEAIQEFACLNVPHVLKSVEPIEFQICKEIKTTEKSTDYYPSLLLKDMNNLQDVKNEYMAKKDRVSRLMFLSNYLNNSKNLDETVLETGNIQSKGELSSKNYLSYVVSTEECLNKQKLLNSKLGRNSTIKKTFTKPLEENRNSWKVINLSKKVVPINDQD